jgi:hypothetical protein
MVIWKAYFFYLLRKESMLYKAANGKMIQAGEAKAQFQTYYLEICLET